MPGKIISFLLCLHARSFALAGALCWPAILAAAEVPSADTTAFAQKVRPILQKYCFRCHGPDKQEADFRIDKLGPDMLAEHSQETWLEMVNRVNAGKMPPPKKADPLTAIELDQFSKWTFAELNRVTAATHGSGGRIVIRRLNRQEYNNTIRDLVGVPFDAGKDFPSDAAAYGFDNIGSALSVSPLHMEKYVRAASKVLDRAIVSGPQPKRECWRILGKLRYKDDRGYYFENDAKYGSNGTTPREDRGRLIVWALGAGKGKFDTPDFSNLMPIEKTRFNNDTLKGYGFTFLTPGEYIVRVRAYGHYPEPRYPDSYLFGPPRLNVTINGTRALVCDVTATEKSPQIYESRFYTEAVKTDIYVRNRYDLAYNLIIKSLGKKLNTHSADFPMPYLAVNWYEIDGPVYDSWPPESHKRILFASPNRDKEEVYAREVIEAFATRAFRRPAQREEIDRLVEGFKRARPNKPNFEEAIKVPLIAVLCSPSFLFLAEDPPAKEEGPRPLNDFELASRLSYYIWSSMPDDELFRLAQEGKLKDNATLAAQVKRMLKSPKSQALVDNFAGQWLGLRKLGEVTPDEGLFPQYGEHLEESMAGETKSFFAEILHNDLSVMNFIDSDFAMLNERLARFYQIEGVRGDQFRKVALKPEYHRGGVLTQASMLSLTSNGTRTSPVKRGVWILENILGDPPPPPPPNAGEIPPPKTPGAKDASVRDRLAIHRSVPACAACHAKIDPLGFALENYDASGFYRTIESSRSQLDPHKLDPKVDAHGELPDGSHFAGIEELKAILLKEPDKFLDCLSEKMLIYALGRGLTYTDHATITQLRESMKQNGYHLSGLITGIVQTKVFQSK